MAVMVTLTGRFVNPDETPAFAGGRMTFQLVPGDVPDQAINETVVAGPVSTPIVGGEFSVSLRATDDEDLLASVNGPLVYRVTRTGSQSTWLIPLPQPGPWDWTDLAPEPDSTTVVLPGAGGAGMPPGGAPGQVLAKETGADYITHWVTAATGGGGGGGGVISSPAGNGPAVTTIASYTGDGFAALATKDAHTLYVVTAAGGAGSLYLGASLLLGTSLAVPDPPPTIVATPGDTTATVNWSAANSPGLSISSYIVQRSTNPTTGFVNVGTVAAGTLTFTSTGLTNGTPYYLRVRAVNAMGNGGFSNVVTATPVTGSTITLASDDLTADAGVPVTFTATVRSGGVAIGAVGNVTFKRGGNVMGGVAVTAGGVATYTTPGIPVGTWTITAEYDGGSTYLPSASTPLSQVIQFPGGPAPTAALLTSNDASSTPSQSVTFSCAVTRTATGAPVNSGSVLFKDGATTISPSRPVDPVTGIATFATSVLTTATHTITATFSGAPFYGPCTSNPVTQVVAPGTGGSPIAQTVYSSKPLAAVGEVVSLRSTVRSGTSAVTTGTVAFYDGATLLGAGSPLNIFGESTLVLTGLAVGGHTITARYAGGGAYEDDTSSPLTQTVAASITAPSPNTWAAAFASDDLATITAWFDYNTGHLTEGFTNASLWNPAGAGSIADVLVTAAWLTANTGPNVVNDGGGHWTITGLHTSHLSARVGNLTFRHCWIERRNYAAVFGPGFDVYDPSIPDPKTDGVTIGHIRFENCTWSTDGTGGDSTFGDAIYFVPATAIPDDVVFDHCEVTMWTAAFKAVDGVTVNYCWVHDLNLFGFDPHNTSASIRSRQDRLYRNLFCDGTSSCVSLYSDYNPHTDFWVTENVMWVNPLHASQEVNFPLRATGFSPLLPGYEREFVGNKFLDGTHNGDNQYWSKIAGNSQLATRWPLYGGADPVQIAGTPTLLALPSTGQLFGASQEMPSLHYTPSDNSVLLDFMMIGRAGTTLNPSIAVTDESGSVWLPVEGCATPIALASGGGGAGPTIYAASCDIWQMQTGAGPQAFRRIIIDPYTTTNVAYMAAMIVELTGIPTLNLAQPPVMSNAGVDVPFDGTVASLTSGLLATPATPGNIVLCFVGYNHETKARMTAPDGWNMLGSNYDPRTSAACLWRDDFAGRSVTIPAFPPECSVAITVMIEIVTP